jgi:hypothetical protein
MHRYRVAAGLAVFVAALSSCAKREVPIVEVKGECGDLFKAQVCTWAHTQGTAVVDVGATVPLASIENAPAEGGEMHWPPLTDANLKLPESVVAQTGLNHLTVYWEAHGHPPGAYLTPHWDFHFYGLSSADRMAIDCKDLTKPASLAAGYGLPDVPLPPDMGKMIGVDTLIGLCVPQMGMHSALASELASTGLFQGTMVVGYYHGKPIFVEPMLTREKLMAKQSFDLPIADVPGLTGPHPRTFHADYDAQQQQYRFVFSGFAATN